MLPDHCMTMGRAAWCGAHCPGGDRPRRHVHVPQGTAQRSGFPPTLHTHAAPRHSSRDNAPAQMPGRRRYARSREVLPQRRRGTRAGSHAIRRGIGFRLHRHPGADERRAREAPAGEALNKAILAFPAHAALQRLAWLCMALHWQWGLQLASESTAPAGSIPAAHPCAAWKRRTISVSPWDALNKAILAFSARAALQTRFAACFGINRLRRPIPAAHPCAAWKRRTISVSMKDCARDRNGVQLGPCTRARGILKRWRPSLSYAVPAGLLLNLLIQHRGAHLPGLASPGSAWWRCRSVHPIFSCIPVRLFAQRSCPGCCSSCADPSTGVTATR